jgi:hypothetical protein
MNIAIHTNAKFSQLPCSSKEIITISRDNRIKNLQESLQILNKDK